MNKKKNRQLKQIKVDSFRAGGKEEENNKQNRNARLSHLTKMHEEEEEEKRRKTCKTLDTVKKDITLKGGGKRNDNPFNNIRLMNCLCTSRYQFQI